MIDPKLLREDPERVRASQRARGEDPSLVDAALAADERHRSSLAEFERLRAEQKSFGKRVARAGGEEKQALLGEVKELARQTAQATEDIIAKVNAIQGDTAAAAAAVTQIGEVIGRIDAERETDLVESLRPE